MKKRIRLLFLVLLFIIFSVGISYSYFIYRRASDTSVINLSLPEKKAKTKKKTADIVTVNSYPMNATTARTKTDNYIDFEVETDSGDESMSYCIGIEYGNIVRGKDRFDLSQISFDLTNADSTYYLSDFSFDEIEHAECIRVVTLAPNSGTHKDNYRLRYWINESATVSDTDPDAKFKSTDDDLTDERDLFTDMFASFRVTITGSDRNDLSMSFTRLSTAKLHTTLGLTNSAITSVTYTNTNNSLVSNYESATKKSNGLASSGDPIIYAYANDSNKITLYSDAYIYAPANLSAYFQSYSSLDYLGFDNLFLTNVKDLSNTFNGCTSLTSLDLSDKKLPSLSNLQDTFYNCNLLDEILFGNYFNTLNVSIYTNMFRACTNLTSLDLSFMDFRNATNLASMFYGCSKLASMDFGYCDFRKVTDFSRTFYNCSKLANLTWETTNTPLVTTFEATFSRCKFTQLDMSNITIDSVTTASNMFAYCESLVSIDLSNFANNNLGSVLSMFSSCTSLKVIKIPNLDTSNVSTMEAFFYDCSNLVSIVGIENLDTSNVVSFISAFYNCSSLIELNLSKWNSTPTDTSNMFWGCAGLKMVDISGIDNSSIASFAGMFNGCAQLKTIYVGEKWGAHASSTVIFNGCTSLVGGSGFAYNSSKKTYSQAYVGAEGYLTLRGSSSNTRGDVVTGDSLLVNFNTLAGTTSNPTDYRDLFGTITSIKFDNRKHNGFKIDVSYYGDGSVLMYVDGSAAYVSAPSKIVFPANCNNLFSSFINLESINTNHYIDTSSVTSMQSTFRTLTKLTSLDLSDFDLSHVTNFFYCFAGSGLTTLDLSNRDLTSSTSFDHTFYNCKSLTTLNLTGTTTYAKTYFCMFYHCNALTSLDLSGFDTSNATTIRGMFRECRALTELDISSFDTVKVKTMYNLFKDCINLATIYASSSFVDTAVITDDTSGGDSVDGHSSVFAGCASLVGGNGTAWATGNTSSTYAVIDTASTPGYFTLRS